MLKRFIIFCAFMIFSLPVQAAEIARKHIPDAEFVGEGRLTYMFWDVYDASLFAPGGDWEPGEPLALELIYLRDITGKQIADRSLDEMEDLGMDDSVRLNEWYNDMVRIFPDVTDGFVLTGVLTPRGETVFYKHDQEIGRVADPEFGHYFFDIWLSAETSAPDLRAKLLGRNKS